MLRFHYRQLIVIVLFCLPAMAGTFYVSPTGTAPWTGAGNCTAIGTPCALATANTNAVAGDLVYLRAGTYSTPITPANSGTNASSRITFMAYTGETPVITTGGTDVELNGLSFIRISGLTITETAFVAIVRIENGAHHIEFDHNTVSATALPKYLLWLSGRGTSCPPPSGTGAACLWVTHVWIHDNTFTATGKAANGTGCTDDGFDAVKIGELITGAGGENDNNQTIENNVFIHGGHAAFATWGLFEVIRNNVFRNEPWSVGCTTHTPTTNNDYTYGAGETISGTGAITFQEPTLSAYNGAFGHRSFDSEDFWGRWMFNLIENNRIGGSGVNPANDGAESMTLGISQTIVRYNNIYAAMGAGIMLKYDAHQSSSAGFGGTYNRLYNNTIIQSGYGYPAALTVGGAQDSTAPWGESAIALYCSTIKGNCATFSSSEGNVLKNNIFRLSAGYSDFASDVLVKSGGNNAWSEFTAANIGNNWCTSTQTSSGGCSTTGDPLFTNPDVTNPASTTLPDLTLQPTSTAIDGGTWLTTATNTASTPSATLTVADAMYFQDGTWGSDLSRASAGLGGTLQADWICITTISNCVQLSAVTYGTNLAPAGTLTLASTKTWTTGDHIWLYKKSDGSTVLNGSAPDYGASEYFAPTPGHPANITVSSSRITVTAGKITVNPPSGSSQISAYNGVDIIQWPTVPSLGGLTDNGATVYDTSFLGHTMWDGSTYAGTQSPITRVTDSVSAPGRQYKSYTAGQGGSGVFTLTNTDTTIVGVNETSFERLCIFNNSLAPGRCLPASSYTAAGSTSAQPASGIVLTTNMNSAGGGSSSTPVDFGSIQFSSTDRTLHYVFGSNSHLTASLAVTPVTISLKPATLGIYTLGSTLADFTFGLPTGTTMAPEWLTAHAYANGAYVTHTLTAGEMATGGVWTALTTYNLGDIVTSGGAGAGNCMYRVIAVVSGTSGTSGSTSPTFDTTAPCANDTLPSGTTFDGSVRWRGTNSTAAFVYQNTGAACTSGASFTISGHPDLLSTVSDGVGGCTSWQNMGPSYVPTQDSMLWNAIGGVSNDMTYNGYASKYAEATSTDSYGGPTATAAATRYKSYAAGQGTGIWVHYYDATANSYHLLNTATGIWTKTTCSGGTGYNCSGGTWSWSTVGTLTAISNNPTIGHACGFATHNSKLDPTGSYVEVQNQVFFDTTCNSLNSSLMWKPLAAFNASTSLQYVFGGTNHWCLTPSKMVAFNGNSFSQTSGVFITQYDLLNVSASPVYSVYLQNFPNQSCAQVSNPPGSYVTAAGVIKSPDANIAEAVDSHLSCAAGTANACGTTYNYGTLSPIAFNAWQNMETCYPLGPTASSVSTAATCTSTPLTSIGPVKQYTHTFATGSNTLFSSQFQISEYSQDGKWLLWSSDWNCSLGSLDGTAPVVNANGFLGQLPVNPVPASPGSFCGLPWQASHAYVAGNMINPIENTSGSGGVDDVYQAVAVNGTGTSGPPSSLGNNQPKCGMTSCWTQTTAPTASTAGTYVCDSSDGLSNLVSATLPTCTNGVIWQDVGPQTSRGDVFAVRLAN